MKRTLQRLANHALRAARPVVEVTVGAADELVTLAHRIDKQPLRMLVPVELLRMQGGYAFDKDHPFLIGLAGGGDALAGFYAARQPVDIAEFYGVASGRSGADLPPWELPWYGRAIRAAPAGELSLGADHGVSFYGPCSDEKVALEMSRLNGIAASIKQYGYDPDGFGDIEGYVILAKGRARFFVRGGKHRVAVLVHLGHRHIPVGFRAGFPRLVDAAQAGFWPLVAGGGMDVTLAQDIMAKYVE